MKIRRATSEDAAALAEFGARTFYETFAADNTPEDMARHLASAWSPDLQRAEIADPRLDTLLAIDSTRQLRGLRATAGGARAGTACRRKSRSSSSASMSTSHGRAAGWRASSWPRSKREARARGARELWLGVWERNARAQAFYRKCGFRAVGTQIFVVGSDPQTDEVMLKEIA